MKLRCKIGWHKWGKKKQWIKPNGETVNAEMCKNCGKVKK